MDESIRVRIRGALILAPRQSGRELPRISARFSLCLIRSASNSNCSTGLSMNWRTLPRLITVSCWLMHRDCLEGNSSGVIGCSMRTSMK